MSGREWKPGDVAMIRDIHNGMTTEWAAAKDDKGWASLLPDVGWVSDADVINARPLVVIDPEDREQVERLSVALSSAAGWMSGGDSERGRTECLQTALRSLIAPPKPDEPKGLGAVVEDAAGDRWVRTHRDLDRHWRSGEFGGVYRTYDEVSPVRILSHGVEDES